MSLDLDPGSLVNGASGLLLVLLGGAIAVFGPRRREDALLALFAGAFGWAFFLGNLLSHDDPLNPLMYPLTGIAALVAAVALVGVGLVFPRRLHRRERRLLRIPALLGAATAAAFLPALARAIGDPATGPGMFDPGLRFWEFVFDDLGLTGIFSASMFMLALLAERFRAASGPNAGRFRRQLALMAAALVFYPGVLAGADLSGAFAGTTPATEFYGIPEVAALGVVSALWLRNSAVVERPARRVARDLALLTLAVPLASLVLSPSLTPPNDVLFGLARLLAVAVLVYAILRHQLLGLDMKVKWTVRQSTVAAAFVGVFFVVSESASTFFASTGLGPYLGIAAAGLLVFAIAPLQRAAERVADVAMPGVVAPGQMTPDERRRIYLEQARAAWADGAITRDERVLLDRLREGLGLSRDEASRLEGEAAAGG